MALFYFGASPSTTISKINNPAFKALDRMMHENQQGSAWPYFKPAGPALPANELEI